MKRIRKNGCDYDQLLSNFHALLPLKKRPKTLLEISRFPHSELAHSNILAFFLNPNEEHGLGDIFLSAVLVAVNSHLASDSLGEVKVFREDRTDSNKSIDLVIEGESFVIGIEHKIWAKPYNPFREYRQRLEDRARRRNISQTNIELILLGLKPEQQKDLYGFKPITHKYLFGILEPQLRQKHCSTNDVGCRYAWEFITTIKNLTEGTHMDSRFFELVQRDQKTSVKLYLEFQRLLEELKAKRDEFIEGIKLHPPFGNLWKWDDQNEGCEFFSTAAVDVKVADDLVLRVEANFYLTRWEICVYKKKGNEAKANIWLQKLGSPAGTFKSLPYSEDIITVQASFTELIQTIELLLES